MDLLYANRFLWVAHWLEIRSNHFCSSMGPNGGSVAMDSEVKVGVRILTLNILKIARQVWHSLLYCFGFGTIRTL
jgi:hypothetical protein